MSMMRSVIRPDRIWAPSRQKAKVVRFARGMVSPCAEEKNADL